MAMSELSFSEVHEYILEKGGKVANRELVKHFKKYLTHPETRNDARTKFKEYVNTLATSKTEGEEKFVTLRPKYAKNLIHSPVHLPQNTLGIPSPISPGVQQDYTTSPSSSRPRQPPPYRPPPPVMPPGSPSPSFDNISLASSNLSAKEWDDQPPQVPPRKKSQSRTSSTEQDDVKSEELQAELSEQAISVKERTQKFNRLASVDNDLSPQIAKEKKKVPESGADEDDGVSVTSVEPVKRTEWIVAAARGDYQALAKLAAANPRLVKTKDPFTTALHWAAKHGNLDIVKLIAGTYNADVNARTNGGYTPLHIAMQFGHKEVFELLIDVYGAIPDIRDWSGKKPINYLRTKRSDARIESYLKLKVQKKSSEKDLGFLRIGSLNVRVKKTTEAFSNFLGVGSSGSIAPTESSVDKVHKSWGSADNVFKDNEMAAPKLLPNSKRKMKYTQEYATSYSTPSTPNQKRCPPTHLQQDSDSDTACGFDSNWKH